ncbi:DUF4124 domain-containing protein [Rhodoferax sp. TH121]|nr:DUF4124 domain-containing protein [Rhodoferax sp. TH121]
MRLTNAHSLLYFTAALLLCAATASAQGVYKWVDAEGKTHYGSQPPTSDKGGEALKLHSNSGFGGNNSGKVKPPVEYNADGTKKIPKGVQEMGEGLMKGLQKVDPKEEPLNCSVAVENVRYQLDLMLEVGQKNAKDGYITQSDFDTKAAKLRQAKSEVTLTDCQLASGNKKSFYQCMSNSKNHVTGCGNKYSF